MFYLTYTFEVSSQIQLISFFPPQFDLSACLLKERKRMIFVWAATLDNDQFDPPEPRITVSQT